MPPDGPTTMGGGATDSLVGLVDSMISSATRRSPSVAVASSTISSGIVPRARALAGCQPGASSLERRLVEAGVLLDELREGLAQCSEGARPPEATGRAPGDTEFPANGHASVRDDRGARRLRAYRRQRAAARRWPCRCPPSGFGARSSRRWPPRACRGGAAAAAACRRWRARARGRAARRASVRRWSLARPGVWGWARACGGPRGASVSRRGSSGNAPARSGGASRSSTARPWSSARPRTARRRDEAPAGRPARKAS